MCTPVQDRQLGGLAQSAKTYFKSRQSGSHGRTDRSLENLIFLIACPLQNFNVLISDFPGTVLNQADILPERPRNVRGSDGRFAQLKRQPAAPVKDSILQKTNA